MKQLLLIISILGFSLQVIAQDNLARNPSFEEFVICPTGLNQINEAGVLPWREIASPNYYNQCAMGTNVGITPQNLRGMESPRTGNAYAGVVVNWFPGEGQIKDSLAWREEYITQELVSPLEVGKRYYVEFYVSLAEGSTTSSAEIGLLFHKDDKANERPRFHLFAEANNVQIPNTFPASQNYTNTNGWTKISGFFIPESSGYKYFTIGMFGDQTIQPRISNWPNPYDNAGEASAEYYIEDVLIQELVCCPDLVDNKVYDNVYTFLPNLTQVNDFIETRNNVIVASGQNITFEAGNQIRLNPGFTVIGNFEAKIVQCEANLNGPFSVFIPNAFSPNGDGINDIWAVMDGTGGTGPINADAYELQIYNRWGTRIHHVSDFDPINGFNGGDIFWDGSNAMTTTYYYVLELYNCDNVYSKSGSITSIGNGNNLAIFPNPSDGIINITTLSEDNDFELKKSTQIIGVEVIDKFQKSVYSSNNIKKSDAIKLDLSHLKSDIYYLRITTNDEVITERIVIEK